MYSFLVTSQVGAWDSRMYEYPRDRFCEYTADALKAQFASLSDDAIQKLLSLPTLFAYEGTTHDMRVGSIRRISDRGRAIYIEFDFEHDVPPIPFSKIEPLKLPLDIKDRFELSRTHWAIKNEDLRGILARAGLLAPRTRKGTTNPTRFLKAVLEASIYASPLDHGLTEEHIAAAGAVFGLKRGELVDAVELACKGGECERIRDQRVIRLGREASTASTSSRSDQTMTCATQTHSKKSTSSSKISLVNSASSEPLPSGKQ